ncbi:uncharacterized protein [Hyperolius riggenbachi]|uniref:uncharacterized protein n=1 Tax=Hyperolius riggenbachi TaxID=752182 RepID=UPI0035A311B1
MENRDEEKLSTPVPEIGPGDPWVMDTGTQTPLTHLLQKIPEEEDFRVSEFTISEDTETKTLDYHPRGFHEDTPSALENGEDLKKKDHSVHDQFKRMETEEARSGSGAQTRSQNVSTAIPPSQALRQIEENLQAQEESGAESGAIFLPPESPSAEPATLDQETTSEEAQSTALGAEGPPPVPSSSGTIPKQSRASTKKKRHAHKPKNEQCGEERRSSKKQIGSLMGSRDEWKIQEEDSSYHFLYSLVPALNLVPADKMVDARLDILNAIKKYLPPNTPSSSP